MFNQIGMSEVLVILVIALLVFGARRLPEMGAAMGKGIREFKKNISDVKTSLTEADAAPRMDAAARPDEDREPKKLSQ
jgi:sec-independent protein translocase protein TatA